MSEYTFQEVGQLEQYPLWDFKKNRTLQARYLKPREIAFDDGNRIIYDFELSTPTTFKLDDSTVESKIVSVWGTTVLNNKIKRALEEGKLMSGDMVRLTMLGQNIKSKKGQKAYDWTLEVGRKREA